MAEIIAVCVSAVRGVPKTAVEAITLRPGHGIVGDAHAGSWHRQVSLLADESVEKIRARLPDIRPGTFAENLLTRGIELHTLPVGTRLRAGTSLLQVTQIGKECHSSCAIRSTAGDCVMPREGVFAVVLEGGTVKAGDKIEVIG